MKKSAVVVDFGTSKIVTLVAESGSYHRCDIIGVGNVPYDGFMDEDWNVPNAVSDAIRDSIGAAEEQSNRRIKDVYVGVPGAFSRVYVAETQVQLQGADPRVTAADVETIFRQATELIQPIPGAIVHRAPAWFMVDEGKKTMEPVDTKGTTLRAMVCFVVADQFFLSDVSSRMDALGITVRGFFSTPMGEVMHLLQPDERDHTAVLIDVGYLQTEVMACQGDALVFHKVLPVGGGHITADLVQGLESSMVVCEKIKRGFVFGADDQVQEVVTESGKPESYTHEQVADVLEPRVDELCEMILECIESSGIRLTGESNLYLTGGGIAMMNGARIYISKKLGRTVRIASNRTAKLNSPIYSSVLGLADMVFDTLESNAESESIIEKITNFFSSLFGR